MFRVCWLFFWWAFWKPIPSIPPREVLYNYIIGRVSKGKLKNKIKFNTRVTSVNYIADKFEVVYQDKSNNKIQESMQVLNNRLLPFLPIKAAFLGIGSDGHTASIFDDYKFDFKNNFEIFFL